MNFLKNTQPGGVITYTDQTFYGGYVPEADGIDLRLETHKILYGYGTKKPLGHWIVLRQYDRTKPSPNYNRQTQEGIGAPPWEYTDYLIRARRSPVSKNQDVIDELKAGVILDDHFVYYVEYFVNPKVGDHILELDITDHAMQPTLFGFTDRLRIKRVIPERMEYGNIQYNAIVAVYDETSP